jgi:hypothetical protein
MGTKVYTVHYRQEASGSLAGLAEDAILVKDGFSWPAFFLAPLWLISKRMWIVLAFYIAAELALTAVAYKGWLPEDALTVLSLGISLLLGLEGNDLYRWTLARRRYRERATVAGDNLVAAEHRFFTTVAEGRSP